MPSDDVVRARTAEPARLLVVEDEEHLAAALRLNLELEGFEVVVAASGREAAEAQLSPRGFDAIVLDVMLPDVDGFAFCEKLRSAGNFTPVLMLTARNDPDDRVRGLEAGADDYLAKPFELPELLARVRSLLRRRHWDRREEQNGGPRAVVTIGDARVDFDAHEVTVRGQAVKLTRLEFDLLRYFVEHPGKVVSRQHLLQEVWKLHNYSTARTVDNFVSRLRRHIERDPQAPVHIVSVRGAGYKFVP